MMRACLLAAFLVAGSADAAIVPGPAGPDPQVRIVRYRPDEVIRFDGVLGFATTIEFGPGEKIENVSIGDALGWQVTPNRKATLLFLKPVDRAAATNMTVVTDLRVYNFELHVRPNSRNAVREAIFALKFDYPAPAVIAVKAPAPPPAPPPPTDLNHAYSFSGADKGLPTRVFDDGHFTYFKFPEATDLPAVFVLEDGDKEAVANIAQRDGYLVVDVVARGFVLRRGTLMTKVVNDAFRSDAEASELTRRKK
jgi:type IV secretion system protein VirB9